MRKEIYGYLIIRLHERDESLNESFFSMPLTVISNDNISGEISFSQ